MSCNKSFIPYTHLVLEKAFKKAKIVDSDDEMKIKSFIDKVVLEDDEVGDRINSIAEELKMPPPEPMLAVTFRAILRPTITLILTATFITLVLGQVGIIGDAPTEAVASEAFYERWDKAFTVFLAIYGPIIGFWFGERTVEKKTAS